MDRFGLLSMFVSWSELGRHLKCEGTLVVPAVISPSNPTSPLYHIITMSTSSAVADFVQVCCRFRRFVDKTSSVMIGSFSFLFQRKFLFQIALLSFPSLLSFSASRVAAGFAENPDCSRVPEDVAETFYHAVFSVRDLHTLSHLYRLSQCVDCYHQ